MYRTYRNLYRVRPSLSSIGQGKYRLSLPRGMTLTLDMVILFLVFLVVVRILIAPILAWILGPYPWVWAILIAGVGAYYASKVDPSGKPVINYLYDLLKFLLRSKSHDGWEKKERRRKRTIEKNQVRVCWIDNGQVGSLPAMGKTSEFDLRVKAGVKIKGNQITIGRQGKLLSAGVYRVEKGSIEPVRRPPKLKRS